jgi:hypothetical protein
VISWSRALDWYFAQPNADRGAVAAWTQVPAELKDPALGWDTTLASAENRLTNDLFSFASADALGQFVEGGLHGFLHGAAARHYHDPVVGTVHSPASTLFYRLHRLVQLWWDRWEQRRPRAAISVLHASLRHSSRCVSRN